MATQNKLSAPKKTKNPLLSGADLGFPFDNLCGSAILMPIAHEETSVPAQESTTPSSFLQPLETPPPSVEPSAPPAPISKTPLFTLFKQVITGEIPDPFSSRSAPPPAQIDFVPLYTPPITSTVQPSLYGNDNFPPQNNNVPPVPLYPAMEQSHPNFPPVPMFSATEKIPNVYSASTNSPVSLYACNNNNTPPDIYSSPNHPPPNNPSGILYNPMIPQSEPQSPYFTPISEPSSRPQSQNSSKYSRPPSVASQNFPADSKASSRPDSVTSYGSSQTQNVQPTSIPFFNPNGSQISSGPPSAVSQNLPPDCKTPSRPDSVTSYGSNPQPQNIPFFNPSGGQINSRPDLSLDSNQGLQTEAAKPPAVQPFNANMFRQGKAKKRYAVGTGIISETTNQVFAPPPVLNQQNPVQIYDPFSSAGVSATSNFSPNIPPSPQSLPSTPAGVIPQMFNPGQCIESSQSAVPSSSYHRKSPVTYFSSPENTPAACHPNMPSSAQNLPPPPAGVMPQIFNPSQSIEGSQIVTPPSALHRKSPASYFSPPENTPESVHPNNLHSAQNLPPPPAGAMPQIFNPGQFAEGSQSVTASSDNLRKSPASYFSAPENAPESAQPNNPPNFQNLPPPPAAIMPQIFNPGQFAEGSQSMTPPSILHRKSPASYFNPPESTPESVQPNNPTDSQNLPPPPAAMMPQIFNPSQFAEGSQSMATSTVNHRKSPASYFNPPENTPDVGHPNIFTPQSEINGTVSSVPLYNPAMPPRSTAGSENTTAAVQNNFFTQSEALSNMETLPSVHLYNPAMPPQSDTSSENTPNFFTPQSEANLSNSTNTEVLPSVPLYNPADKLPPRDQFYTTPVSNTEPLSSVPLNKTITPTQIDASSEDLPTVGQPVLFTPESEANMHPMSNTLSSVPLYNPSMPPQSAASSEHAAVQTNIFTPQNEANIGSAIPLYDQAMQVQSGADFFSQPNLDLEESSDVKNIANITETEPISSDLHISEPVKSEENSSSNTSFNSGPAEPTVQFFSPATTASFFSPPNIEQTPADVASNQSVSSPEIPSYQPEVTNQTSEVQPETETKVINTMASYFSSSASDFFNQASKPPQTPNSGFLDKKPNNFFNQNAPESQKPPICSPNVSSYFTRQQPASSEVKEGTRNYFSNNAPPKTTDSMDTSPCKNQNEVSAQNQTADTTQNQTTPSEHPLPQLQNLPSQSQVFQPPAQYQAAVSSQYEPQVSSPQTSVSPPQVPPPQGVSSYFTAPPSSGTYNNIPLFDPNSLQPKVVNHHANQNISAVPLFTSQESQSPFIPVYNPYDSNPSSPVPMFSASSSQSQSPAPVTLFTPPPPSIPVSVSQINPKHTVTNPYSKSTVSPVSQLASPPQSPVTFFSPPPASIPVSVSQVNPKHPVTNPYSKSTVSPVSQLVSSPHPPVTLFSPQPASIPVSVSQINPKHPVMNPYSQSTASPVPQHESLLSDTATAETTKPPPPKAANMSGNSYRLGGGSSRPQYAPPPGLGSSVSAIASLAASMAISTPLPVPTAQPHYEQPYVSSNMPSIVASAPGASSAAELFTPGSLPQESAATYRPVYHHWFFKRELEGQTLWNPFSMTDSMELEKAAKSGDKELVIATDGGRYDVQVAKRLRTPVYWSQPPNEVRRCSWFYKGALDSRSAPYEESFATKLEEEYRNAFLSNRWPRRIELSFGEAIILNGPTAMMHLPPTSGSILEDWGSIQEQGTKPRSVRRGCDEYDIDEGEPAKPDHLLFLVHGIGSVCDLKFRSVVEVVDDFRSLALTLVRSHFRQAGEEGRVNRVEVLPVSWHGALHGEETGIDKQLQGITLKSIPRLRHFTNDTLLDILFYTSPVYCQTIIRTVGHELNRLQQLFMKRNPTFSGGISLGGHSLGSLILFDLLCHQRPSAPMSKPHAKEDPLMFEGDEEEEEDEFGEPIPPPRSLVRRESCRVDYMVGPAGTGQPTISYPQLHFNPMSFFALGSPIGMFVTVRGIESLGKDFCLPTCPGFLNIFHPFDPVAYRCEALINPELSKLRPVVIPHHKGRKRMHIELRETMARVGTDLKERLVDSVKSTWNTVYQLAMFNRGEMLEQEVDKVLAEQLLAQDALLDEPLTTEGVGEQGDPDPALLGRLNGGRRFDYVLQEAPLESFNEYLFALGSHVCYWESEDTMLLMLKEIYNFLGVNPDRQFERSRENSISRDGGGRERSWSAGSKGSKGSKGSPSTSLQYLSLSKPTPPYSTPPSDPPPQYRL